MNKIGFKPIPAAIALGLALLIWFVIPVPDGVTPQAWHLLAMFVGVIAAIIGKAMPIGALSIIAVMLVAVTQVTVPELGADGNPIKKPAEMAIKDALSSFADPLIWLIGISIMISRGILKTGLGARIGYYFISLFGKKTLGIGYSLALSELILAPVTPSNTARGGGIIHPVMKAISSSYDSDPEKGTQGRIGRYLALVNYHSNPITSAMFITATAPNPLVVDLIAKATDSKIHLSWGTWALAMLLPGLVAMFLMPLVLYFVYPPEIKETPNAAQFAKDRLKEQGPMNRGEKIMLAIFAVLLVLWAGIPAMIFGKAFTVHPTATAFIGLSLLLLSGVLTWDDVLKEKGAWDTVVWFSALVMMASFLNKLGLIGWFSDMLGSGIKNTGMGWVGASALLLLIYMYAHYYVRQHHRPHHGNARRVLCRRAVFGCAADGFRPDDCRRIQPDDDADPLRYRHRARYFRFGLYDTGRMVEGRVCDERGKPAGVCGCRRNMVEGFGLLVRPSEIR